MGRFLLQDPWVHLYLLYVGALVVLLAGAYWRNPPAPRDGTRTHILAKRDRAVRN